MQVSSLTSSNLGHRQENYDLLVLNEDEHKNHNGRTIPTENQYYRSSSTTAQLLKANLSKAAPSVLDPEKTTVRGWTTDETEIKKPKLELIARVIRAAPIRMSSSSLRYNVHTGGSRQTPATVLTRPTFAPTTKYRKDRYSVIVTEGPSKRYYGYKGIHKRASLPSTLATTYTVSNFRSTTNIPNLSFHETSNPSRLQEFGVFYTQEPISKHRREYMSQQSTQVAQREILRSSTTPNHARSQLVPQRTAAPSLQNTLPIIRNKTARHSSGTYGVHGKFVSQRPSLTHRGYRSNVSMRKLSKTTQATGTTSTTAETAFINRTLIMTHQPLIPNGIFTTRIAPRYFTKSSTFWPIFTTATPNHVLTKETYRLFSKTTAPYSSTSTSHNHFGTMLKRPSVSPRTLYRLPSSRSTPNVQTIPSSFRSFTSTVSSVTKYKNYQTFNEGIGSRSATRTIYQPYTVVAPYQANTKAPYRPLTIKSILYPTTKTTYRSFTKMPAQRHSRSNITTHRPFMTEIAPFPITNTYIPYNTVTTPRPITYRYNAVTRYGAVSVENSQHSSTTNTPHYLFTEMVTGSPVTLQITPRQFIARSTSVNKPRQSYTRKRPAVTDLHYQSFNSKTVSPTINANTYRLGNTNATTCRPGNMRKSTYHHYVTRTTPYQESKTPVNNNKNNMYNTMFFKRGRVTIPTTSIRQLTNITTLLSQSTITDPPSSTRSYTSTNVYRKGRASTIMHPRYVSENSRSRLLPALQINALRDLIYKPTDGRHTPLEVSKVPFRLSSSQKTYQLSTHQLTNTINRATGIKEIVTTTGASEFAGTTVTKDSLNLDAYSTYSTHSAHDTYGNPVAIVNADEVSGKLSMSDSSLPSVTEATPNNSTVSFNNPEGDERERLEKLHKIISGKMYFILL